MLDGNWYTQLMGEVVNQGCPLSATLVALVLNEILVPLNDKLKARSRARVVAGDLGDDGMGGETHIMGYIDDCGSMIPHVDLAFFFRESEALATPLGCHLNQIKTRIIASTSGCSALPVIEAEYGMQIVADVEEMIATF